MLLRLISNSYYFYPLFFQSLFLSRQRSFFGLKFKLLFFYFREGVGGVHFSKIIKFSHSTRTTCSVQFVVLWKITTSKSRITARYRDEWESVREHHVVFLEKKKHYISHWARSMSNRSKCCLRPFFPCNNIAFGFFSSSLYLLSRFTLIMIVLHLLCAHEMDSHSTVYGFLNKEKNTKCAHKISQIYTHKRHTEREFLLSRNRLPMCMNTFDWIALLWACHGWSTNITIHEVETRVGKSNKFPIKRKLCFQKFDGS